MELLIRISTKPIQMISVKGAKSLHKAIGSRLMEHKLSRQEGFRGSGSTGSTKFVLVGTRML